jgi:hypothetical protein
MDIIVDPGTYVYTSFPRERNRFRSTEYHNTVKFDGYEQNDFSDKGIFSLPDRVRILNAEITEEEDKIVFQGEIQYADIIHKRRITLHKWSGNWQITDIMYSSIPLRAKLIYHLSPKITFIDNSICAKETDKILASIEVEGYEFEKNDYDYSPGYGIKIKAESLTADIFVKNKQAVTTYIQRYKGT